MMELTPTVNLYSSSNGATFNAITGIEICKNCGKRTLVCPHKFPKDTIIEVPPNTSHLKVVQVDPDMRITMSTERNTRMTKVLDTLKFTLLESMTSLEDIWEEIGIKENQKEQRNNTVLEHLQDLLKEMLAEEEQLKYKMKLKVEEYRSELDQLYIDLDVPAKQIPLNLTLLQLEHILRNEVDLLNKEKHDRLQSLKRLRNDEELLCGRLVMPQHDLNFVGCPTLEQLRELEQNVKFLKVEKLSRMELFKKLQASIMQLWRELDVEPASDIEERLCCEDADETFVLSSVNLDQLTECQGKLEQEHNDLVQQIGHLREKVNSLWTRLETSEQECNDFNELTENNTPKVAKMFLKEIERLEEHKRLHMQRFVESIRKELVLLWDKCHFGEDRRQLFQAFYSDAFTEESLAEHEHQVTTVKNYYEENKDMFKIVEKRESLWAKKIEFENRSTDCSRLNNRGGALLKEEKMRKAVEKELPKVTADIRKKVIKWEKENEAYFMFNGSRYIDYMEVQRNDYEEEQKVKKKEKLRAKQNELNQELAYGSKANPKRKIMGTPGNKSKMARMDLTHGTPSRFIHSSILPSPRRHPARGAENRHVPTQTPSAKRSKKAIKDKVDSRRKSLKRRSIRLAHAKRVLTDINEPTKSLLEDSKVIKCSSSIKHDPNVSLVSYNDFSNAVAESPYSRSSFMCKPNDRTPNMFNFTNISSVSNTKSKSKNKSMAEGSTSERSSRFRV